MVGSGELNIKIVLAKVAIKKGQENICNWLFGETILGCIKWST